MTTLDYDSSDGGIDGDYAYGRNGFTSPAVYTDFAASPIESNPASNENTPTAAHAHHRAAGHPSPRGKITEWSPKQAADFIKALGTGYERYVEAFIAEGVSGEALIELQHDELKELGVISMGHRLTILRAIYDVKVKQHIPFDPDHYIPLSEATREVRPTQADINNLLQQISLRDQRMLQTEAELRTMKDHLDRVWDDTRKLREDMLPVAKAVKDSSQPLPPNPPQSAADIVYHDPLPSPKNPPPPPPIADTKQSETLTRSLSRKLSTKRFLMGGSKMPSPSTIHEGSGIESSMPTISSHLNAGQPAHAMSQQPSPTSPQYSMNSAGVRATPRDDGWIHSNTSNLIHDPRTTTSTGIAQPTKKSGYGAPSTMTPTAAFHQYAKPAGTPGSVTTGNTIAPLVKPDPNIDLATGNVHSFHVETEQTTDQVLPLALKKWRIEGDPRTYNLYIVCGDNERLLMREEKPLQLFKDLDKRGLKPMFMLRKFVSNEEVDREDRVAGYPPSFVGTVAGGGTLVGAAGGSGSLPGGLL